MIQNAEKSMIALSHIIIIISSLKAQSTFPPHFKTKPPDVVYVKAGESVSLPCEAEGTPSPVIIWYKDNLPLEESATAQIFATELRISNLRQSDIGYYLCMAKNREGNVTAVSKIIVTGPAVITVPPRNITNLEGIRAEFICEATALPSNVTHRWFYNSVEISQLSWLETRTLLRHDGTLVINPISPEDSGKYTCEVTNGIGNPDQASAYLSVEYPARVTYSPTIQYLPLGLSGIVRCYVQANPPVLFIIWRKNERQFDPNSNPGIVTLNNGSLLIQRVSHEHQGQYRCTPYNKHGTTGSSTVMEVLVREPPVFTVKPNQTYQRSVNSEVKMSCDGIGQPKPTITWRRADGGELPWDRAVVHRGNLEIKGLRKEDHGRYECILENKVATLVASTLLLVESIMKPSIQKTNMDGSTVTVRQTQEVTFWCHVIGVPQPVIAWLKDGSQYDTINMSGIEIKDNNQTLIIKRVMASNGGRYECVAQNSGGRATANQTLFVIDDQLPTSEAEEELTDAQVAVIAVLVITATFLLGLAVILGRKMNHDKKQKRDFEFINQALLGRGQLEKLNPDIPLEEQAELLPYDYHWEFPKNRLKLGKTLGQGEFGRVVKAEAIDIKDGETSTTVVVKMLKECANAEHQKALMAELKILIHVGRHLNIVNLLGAVTKNVVRGELMVIVEYCRFGNLRHYLVCQRDKFINQLNPITGKIDLNICAVPLSPGLRKESISHQRSIPSPGINNPVYSQSSGETKDSPVSTCDLICYAFQCARGMEYLAAKKLIHRDLAARNVLLAEDNIVKICDFGIAKDCYKYSNDIKKEKGALPVEWMAIESIGDRIFTNKSDVYDFMQQCWQADPNSRPDFTQLVEKIGDLLEEGVRKYYIDLNGPYSTMNEMTNNNEYLQMDGESRYMNMRPEREHSPGAIPYEGQADVLLHRDNPLVHYKNIEAIRLEGEGPVSNVSHEDRPMT